MAMARGTDVDLPFLQAALNRIDIRLRRQVLLWRRAGRDPSDVYRGLYVSDADAEALLRRPLGAHWGDFVSLTDEEESRFRQAELEVAETMDRLRRRAQETGREPRLDRLARICRLTDFERDAFLIAAAPSIDERYERVYGYLHDDITRKRASPQLVLDLIAARGPDRWGRVEAFGDRAALLRHRVVRWGVPAPDRKGGLLSRPLEVDDSVLRWLFGRYEPDSPPGGRLSFETPADLSLDRVRAGDLIEPYRRLLAQEDRLLIELTGPDVVAQRSLTRLVADQEDRPLLRLEFRGERTRELAAALAMAVRDALLTGAILHLQGLDELPIEVKQEAARVVGASLTPSVGTVLLSTSAEDPTWRRGVDGRRCLRLECRLPGHVARRRLWRAELEARSVAEGPAEQEVAARFLLASGQIKAAVKTALDRAEQAGRPLSGEHLFAAARAHSNPRLSELASKIEPRFEWEDLILPADQLAILRELVATVRQRHQVLDEWGLGDKLVAGRGVTALFAGPPGTGKTMAAGILAGELGLDLYKIDLSTVVSKYIGETEKNLERVFEEAASSNAILFFDEADALFGKRSEVRDSHDRYANLEISYLLQRMEAYDGVTVLATNLRANLDDAFTRRLDFAVDFPFPEEEDRLRIWRSLLPASLPRAGDIDLAQMAGGYKLAGGNIRNVWLAAAHLAAADGGRVTMDHLRHGARRELQKMGRWVREKEASPRPEP